jgi:hypothetical protein
MLLPPRSGAKFKAVVVAAGALLAFSACTGDSGDESTTGPQPADSPSPVVPESTAPAEALYSADGVDVCARTDRSPLKQLALSVKGAKAKPPTSAPGAACLFDLRTKDGHEGTLLVEASTLASTDQAQSLYRATSDVTGMKSDGTISGVGEQADGFTKQSNPGFKYAEYMVHARTGNLVVKVWLAVGGDTYAAKKDLSAATLAITRTTLGLIPRD